MSIVAIQRYYQFLFNIKCHNCDWDDHSIKERTEIADSVLASPIKLRSAAINNSTMLVQYLDYVSNSTLHNICKSFEILNLLDSASLQRKFLSCAGLEIYKHYSDREGNIQIPKQFHNCKNMSFRSSGIITALVSWSGSGDFWVRQLLETTTGIYSGSDQDCDVGCISAGMLGEGIASENVIAVKIHHATEWNFPKNSQIIYIVRDPSDAIMAGWSRHPSKMWRSFSPYVSNFNAKKFSKLLAS